MTTRNLLRLTIALGLAGASAGCTSTGAEPGRAGCVGAGCAIVVTSHFNPDFTGNGTINTVTTANPPLITSNLDSTLDPDVAIQITQGDQEGLGQAEALFLNQDTGSLRRYDLTDFQVLGEFPTGDSTAPASAAFPHDLYELPGSTVVYVTLSGNDSAHALGIVDVSAGNEDASVANAGGTIQYVNLPTVTGDTDGEPNPGNLYFCNGLLYVLQQNYSLAPSTYVVTYQPGTIAIVDPVQKAVLGTIQLMGKNPSAIVPQTAGQCGNVLVAQASGQTTVPDGTGGIEKVDLANRKSLGWLTQDTTLGGRPASVVLASASLGFVTLYYDPELNSFGETFLASVKVSAFNPQTGALINDVTPKKAGQIDFVKVSLDGQLWVGVGPYSDVTDTTRLAEGLYRGRADGTMLPSTPLSGEATDGGSPPGVLANIPSNIAFE